MAVVNKAESAERTEPLVRGGGAVEGAGVLVQPNNPHSHLVSPWNLLLASGSRDGGRPPGLKGDG